jgi:hypothetical protein
VIWRKEKEKGVLYFGAKLFKTEKRLSVATEWKKSLSGGFPKRGIYTVAFYTPTELAGSEVAIGTERM